MSTATPDLPADENAGPPAHAVESGGSFFLDLAEIQKLIDSRWSQEARGGTLLEARETLVVSFKGSLTAAQQPQLRAYFEGRVQKSKLRRLVLDLGEVEYLDSSAVGVLAWLRKLLAAEGGSLKVLAGTAIFDLFKALRMVEYLGVTPAAGRPK